MSVGISFGPFVRSVHHPGDHVYPREPVEVKELHIKLLHEGKLIFDYITNVDENYTMSNARNVVQKYIIAEHPEIKGSYNATVENGTPPKTFKIVEFGKPVADFVQSGGCIYFNYPPKENVESFTKHGPFAPYTVRLTYGNGSVEASYRPRSYDEEVTFEKLVNVLRSNVALHNIEVPAGRYYATIGYGTPIMSLQASMDSYNAEILELVPEDKVVGHLREAVAIDFNTDEEAIHLAMAE